MAKEFGMFINGKFTEGMGAQRLEVHSPSDGELVGAVPIATEMEVDAACRAAQAAFPKWRNMPGAARGQVITDVSNAVRAHTDGIARLLTREQGKTLANAKGEVLGFCAVIQF